jgi:hypothetical protein
MNRKIFSRRITLSILAMLTMIACNLSVSLTSPPPQPTVAQNIQTEPQPTATAQPTLTAEVIVLVITATSPSISASLTPSPSCTVLQDVNLRFGPGTAYRPPIRTVLANSVVTPLGFAPQGIPGGSWAYIQDPATQSTGWVSAGSQYIFCNVELAALPSVAFGTPPPFFPESAQSSDPDGNGFCVDPDSGYKCVGIFSEESLFQFQILRHGNEVGENDGVEQVAFKVKKNGDRVYSNVEKNAAYCLFGGNGPCNTWVFEDGIYKWSPGGEPIESGEYKVEVDITLNNGDDSHWEVFFTVELP